MASRAYPATDEGAGQRAGAVLGLGLWPLPPGAWLPITALALLFAAHILYGALVSDIAMGLEVGAALLLAAALLNRRLRGELARLKGLAIPGGLFGLVILLALWTLTPWIPGGPHPVWAYVGLSPGASTIDKSSTIVEIVKLLGLACVFAIGLLCGAQDQRARFAMRLAIWAGVALGIWAFGIYISHSSYQSAANRLEAHFLSPNTAGLFFGMLSLVAVAEMAGSWRRSRSGDRLEALPLAGAALVLVICLIATASRGAITASLIAVVAYALMQVWTGRLKAGRGALFLAAGLLVGILLVAFAGAELVDRLGHSQENALDRLAVWRAHWGAFLDSPLFGYGLGTVNTVNLTLLNVATFKTLWSINAILNVYLQWLESAGLVGALPMFGAIGAVIVATLRGYGRRSRMTGLLAGLVAADLVAALQGATDFGLDVYSVAAFWAWLLGLQFALAQGTSQR